MTFHWTHQPFGLFDPGVPVLLEPTEAQIELEREFEQAVAPFLPRPDYLRDLRFRLLYESLSDESTRLAVDTQQSHSIRTWWHGSDEPLRRPFQMVPIFSPGLRSYVRRLRQWQQERNKREEQESDAPLTFERHDR